MALALVLAGAGLAAGLFLRDRGTVGTATLEAQVEGTLRPDGSTEPGRTWRIAYEGAELRVYRNGLRWGERCPGGSACTGGPRPELRLPLNGPGEYRAVAFSHGSTAEGGTLHDDVTRARAQGSSVALSAPLIVY